MASPFPLGAFQLRLRPRPHQGERRLPRGPNEDESIHEGVVDGPLQPVALHKPFRRGRARHPSLRPPMQRTRKRPLRRGPPQHDRLHRPPVGLHLHADGLAGVEGRLAGAERKGQGADVGGRDPEGVALPVGHDRRGLPMLAQAIHHDPCHARVTQRMGGEQDAWRYADAALAGEGVDAPVQLGLGRRLVLVARLGCDEVGEIHAEGRHGLLDGLGGLDLSVVRAAVGDHGGHREVERVGGGVVQPPELGLPRERLELLVLEHVQELRRLREPGARGRRREPPRMVHREVPARRAPQAEPAHHHPVLVDRIQPLHVLQRLPEVRLARESRPVAIPAVQVQHERVRRRELARAAHPLVEERQLAQLLPPPMKPKVQPPPTAAVRPPRRRHHQPVRLHRPVDARPIPAHRRARRLRPSHLARPQHRRPFMPRLQQQPRRRQLVRLEDLVVPHRPIHRLLEHLHVRQACRQLRLLRHVLPQLVDVPPEHRRPHPQELPHLRRVRDPRRRHRPHLVRHVVRRPVRHQRRRGASQPKERQPSNVALHDAR